MRLIPVFLTMLLALLPAFGDSVAAETPKSGGRLVYASGTDATTLDPHFVIDVPTSRILMHIHETLVRQNEAGKIEPLLATSWSVSEDRLTWTFKLRQGVRFHDGTLFDAAAVKASFDRLLDPATGSPRRSVGSMIVKVTVVDPETVALTTDKPFSPLLAQLSAYNLAILSPAQLAVAGKDYGRKPAGTGPFKLAAWTAGEKLTLVRNDNYWGAKPLLERVEVRVVPEDSARLMMLLSGEADVVASVPPVMLPRLKASPDVRVIQMTGFRTVFIGLNLRIKPFDDIRVRQAVAHAIDSEAIVKGILGGLGSRGGGLESPVIDGADKNLPIVPYDPAKAKQLLAEAGFPNGFSTVLYTPTGRYLNDRQVAEAVQAQLRAVGITVRLEAPEWATFQQILDKGEKAALFLLGKGSPTGDLDLTLHLLPLSTGSMNYFGWVDPAVDQLIERQRTITDQAERFAMLAKVQQRFYDDQTYVTLFYEDQVFATRAKVHDVKVFPNEFVSLAGAWKE